MRNFACGEIDVGPHTFSPLNLSRIFVRLWLHIDISLWRARIAMQRSAISRGPHVAIEESKANRRPACGAHSGEG